METTTLILGIVILIIICIMFFYLIKINKSVSSKSDITPELNRQTGRLAEHMALLSDGQNKLLRSGMDMLGNRLDAGNEARATVRSSRPDSRPWPNPWRRGSTN